MRADVSGIIGERGSGPGRFSFPRGISIHSDGRLAVADKTGRIQILDPDGAPLAWWSLPKVDNGTPTGIIFDETDPTTDTLLVADTHNSRIFRYSLGGRLLLTFGESGSAPGQMIYPTDIALDPAGNMYLTEYGLRDRIMKFDRDGGFLTEWGGFGPEPGNFQRPMALIWAAPDRIIVADSCNHRIQVFTDTGERIATWGEVGRETGRLNYPYDLCMGPDGLLYIAEYGNNRIQCFDLAGGFRAEYGHAGALPGLFGSPWGIECDALGRVHVADTLNHRLQVIPVREIHEAAGRT